MAKNTLINALRRYALSPTNIGTVPQLIDGAERGYETLNSFISGESSQDVFAIHNSIDDLALVLNRFDIFVDEIKF